MNKKEGTELIFDFCEHLVDSGRFQFMKITQSSSCTEMTKGWATSDDNTGQIIHSIQVKIATRKEMKNEIDYWLNLDDI